MPTPDLRGAIAIVTGASRGVGKGIALGLAEAGATIYITGRTTASDAAPEGLPGTIDQTADELRALGGIGIAVRCDHADDEQVAALFARVHAEQHGRLDLLVNNAFAIPEGRITGPFWELPISQWDTLHRVGLRSHYVAAVHAAQVMVPARRGLIVNVSSVGAKIYAVSVAYGVGKAGVDRMSRDMARELRPHNVSAVSLWPGIVRTERLLQQPDRLAFDPTNGESPTFSGRAVAHLAADPQILARSGESLVVAELAAHYDFTDIAGNRPASLRRT
jgi:dehydrogenase/reductase SDR family protein 1